MYDYKNSRTGDQKEKEAFRSIKKDHGIFCRSVCCYGELPYPRPLCWLVFAWQVFILFTGPFASGIMNT